MKIGLNMKKLISECALVMLMLLGTSNVQAFDLNDLATAVGVLQKGTQALQAGQATANSIPMGNNVGLTELLMQQLGVTQMQAQGGAGAIFQMAKANMQEAAFSKLSSSVPDMQTLLSAAPVFNTATSTTGFGGLASIAGAAMGGNAGSLLGLMGAFQQLGLTPDMMQKFVPVLMQYVQTTGGMAVLSALQAGLIGGL
jgi:hypothetical protein